ncbi:MAG: hypothetical protein ABW210_12620 [Achromobacter sp.]
MTASTLEVSFTGTQGLARALVQNAGAAEAVRQIAAELGVVHAVLADEVARLAREGDALNAGRRTAELEQKLVETAALMFELNEALADEHASMKHRMGAR